MIKNRRHRLVVVGGGFAGLRLVKLLRDRPQFEITLVDVNNYHFFPPLLYQIAMAFIEPANIIYPFRRFFHKNKNIRFHMGRAVRVDLRSNTLQTERSTIYYDSLVLAMGTEPRHFGMENVKKYSWPLKTVCDGINLRNHLLLNIEKAIQSTDEEERSSLLNVVIAGGGPTGVEVAGMLAEMVHTIGPKEYPEIVPGTFKIYLIQSSGELLKSMSKKAQDEALSVLTKFRVRVKLHTRVVDYVDGKVLLNNGEAISTRALIWTSGVIATDIKGFPKETYSTGRRLLVNDRFLVNGTNNVFAVGDISLNTSDERYPEGHPQLAQAAIQQGKYLARGFKKSTDPRDWKEFRYKEKGTMAIISKYKAVADLPRFSLKGFLAWLIWLFIHLVPIAGFRNKLSLALNWAWAFITDNPTLRLIIKPEKKATPKKGWESPGENIGQPRENIRREPVRSSKFRV